MATPAHGKAHSAHPNRRRIIAGLLILVVIAIAIWMLRPKEPSYNGKRLSVWLDDQHWVEGGRIELSQESVQAVRAIGTNAIPFLMAMIQCKDSKAKMWIAARVWRLSFIHDYFPFNATKQRRAMYGFRALGLEAKQAFPELAGLVFHSSENGIFINALTEADAETITLIANSVTDSDSEVRQRAVHALGCLRQAPQISLPALTKALSDSNSDVRATAAGSLGPYQSQAAGLVPILESLLTDTNARVTNCAAESLRLIKANQESKKLP